MSITASSNQLKWRCYDCNTEAPLGVDTRFRTRMWPATLKESMLFSRGHAIPSTWVPMDGSHAGDHIAREMGPPFSYCDSGGKIFRKSLADADP